MRGYTAVFFAFLFAVFAPTVSDAQFVTRGDAVKLSAKCFKITADKLWQYGSIWSENKIDISKPVELEFIIYMGTKDAEGADGIVFLFHNDPRGTNATGTLGGGLGFAQPNGISPSVAVEFDTWQNLDDAADIPADHTAVSYNGNISAPVVKALQIDPGNPDIENNQCHTYKISWNPDTKELKLFFDGQQRFSHTDDIVKNVFRGNPMVYYGFTGSTGGNSNEQTICVLGNSQPVALDDAVAAQPGQAVVVDVLANDSHTGGEPLTLTRIRHQTGKGVARIEGNKIVYIPDAWVANAEDEITYEISDAGSDQCYAKTAMAKLKVKVSCDPNQAPLQITADGPLTFCEGERVKLSVSGPAGANYQWRHNGVLIKQSSTELIAAASGNYSVSTTSVCGTSTSSPVHVTVTPVPKPPVVQDVSRCGPGEVTLRATGEAKDEYRWYNTEHNGTPLATGASNEYTIAEQKTSAVYYVSVVRNGCESERVPVKANIKPIPAVATWAEVVVDEGEGVALTSAAGGATYKWSPASGLSSASVADPVAQPSETTVYTVVVTTADGCQATGQTKVIVRKELSVPNAFSPNGDGVNDTWEIATMEGYPDARVEIFDRWGSRVFEKTGYLNEWDGTLRGKALPQSTYFYVISLGNGRKLTGSVSIVL